ncbi:hypothetical protein GCM10011415_29750 [Salipiger pallidus]|uniref:Exopolysaccharide biosynthesis protein YbjH n=1 Tax=Salipiger pallidus TaxID=1775170 RepID=A0A8J2ZLU9_9RHOB|nr:YjbH domain-containing protein [Salipiger pallidus]GGG78780.1 hypothetical protein GCM10011415_29750 [Salipiger pallidus]
MSEWAVHRATRRGAITVLLVLCGTTAGAQSVPGTNSYGLPGLIDMPNARAMPDGTISLTYGRIGETARNTLTFQITPRLTGAFRYSGIGDFNHPDSVDGVYFDRSFDLRFLLWGEGRIRPAVAIGLQDFIGTGIYAGEYIVATKTITPEITVTGGLGWGRLGSYNTLSTISTRPSFNPDNDEGGNLGYDQWFRGEVAPFAGISWRPTEKLSFSLEYSSDDYQQEIDRGGFEHNSPINIGATYRVNDDLQVSAAYVYGSTFGLTATYTLNPKTIGVPGGLETGGLPVSPREPENLRDLGWANDLESAEASVRQRLVTNLEREDLRVEGFSLRPRSATLRMSNPTYPATAQALGRAARVMTRVLPASVEEFVIIPTGNGVPMSAVTMRRSDLEALENDAAVEMLARTSITDAYGKAPADDTGIYPRFIWSLTPYYDYSTFDPESPLRLDLGGKLEGTLELASNLSVTGSIKKRVIGNVGDIERVDPSELPRVRTDFPSYAREGDPSIDRLTLDYFGRPGTNLYSRLSVGYLEQMYAGASAEVLWKPVDSRLAIGAELNFVRRREFDGLLGVTDNVTTDPVTGIERAFPDFNGHVSAYYDIGNGFHGQLDVGRYLAGDNGATLTVHREFVNGWRVGAFATMTDVSSEEFGEGSFDKGIMITLPLTVGLGTPTKTTTTTMLRPVLRDGGARLNVSNRLYDEIREWHEPSVSASWGRFWR